MTQDELERLLDAARDYNAPPATPREEMWAEIRHAVPRGEDQRLDLDARRALHRRQARMRRWTPWAIGVAAAATLTIGFGLGRITRERPGTLPSSAAVASRSGEAGAGVAGVAGAAGEQGPSLPVRLAAAGHMGEAEALLTLYRNSTGSEDRLATAAWARDLLSTTRMLLDSRVSQDPEMAELLGDLELVLVQIASSDGGNGQEQELIEEGIEQRQLLTKLQSAATPSVQMAL